MKWRRTIRAQSTWRGATRKAFAAVATAALITLGVLGAAPAARAQGTRKDDIVLNALGRPMGGATVRVCTATASGEPCSPLASIYSNIALTTPLANPLTTDGLGNYSFYAAPGLYEIEISGTGITPRQFPNVLLPGSTSGGSGSATPTAFNVLNYGAVGDGHTNDAPAFQLAFNACRDNTVTNFQDGTILIPPMPVAGAEAYQLTSALTFPALDGLHCNIVLQGGVFVQSCDSTLVLTSGWNISGDPATAGQLEPILATGDCPGSPAYTLLQIGDGVAPVQGSVINDLILGGPGGFLAIEVKSALAASGNLNTDLQWTNIVVTGGSDADETHPMIKIRDTTGVNIHGGQFGCDGCGVYFDIGGTDNANGGTTNVNLDNPLWSEGNLAEIIVHSDGPASGPNGLFTINGLNNWSNGAASGGTTTPVLKIDTTNASFYGLSCKDSYQWIVSGTPAFLAWTAGTTGQLNNITLDNCISTFNPRSQSPNRVPLAYVSVPSSQVILGLKIIAPNGDVLTPNLLTSLSAPTIASGFGTSPSIVHHNGTASFTINVGTGGTATSGVVGLPAAANGWSCTAADITTQSTSVAGTVQTASSTTSATLTQYSDVKAATPWAASDILAVSCLGY